MTQQYDQTAINLREATPISLQTPDATAVDILIDRLTSNVSSLTIDLWGGGSAPSDVAGRNYHVTTFSGIAVRDGAGVVSIPSQSNTVLGTGAVPTLALVAVGDGVFLRITPGDATPYDHRLKLSKILF